MFCIFFFGHFKEDHFLSSPPPLATQPAPCGGSRGLPRRPPMPFVSSKRLKGLGFDWMVEGLGFWGRKRNTVPSFFNLLSFFFFFKICFFCFCVFFLFCEDERERKIQHCDVLWKITSKIDGPHFDDSCGFNWRRCQLCNQSSKEDRV